DHEERRLHAFGGERVEDAVGVGRQRAVVEGQHHLVVVERQRLAILHGADARMLVRVDGDGAAHAERAGRALLCARRPDGKNGRQQKRRGDGATHAPASTPTFRQARSYARTRFGESPYSTETLGGGNLMTP